MICESSLNFFRQHINNGISPYGFRIDITLRFYNDQMNVYTICDPDSETFFFGKSTILFSVLISYWFDIAIVKKTIWAPVWFAIVPMKHLFRRQISNLIFRIGFILILHCDCFKNQLNLYMICTPLRDLFFPSTDQQFYFPYWFHFDFTLRLY